MATARVHGKEEAVLYMPISEGWLHCSTEEMAPNEEEDDRFGRLLRGINRKTARKTSNGATTAAHDHDGWFAALSNNEEEVAMKKRRQQWEDDVDGQ